MNTAGDKIFKHDQTKDKQIIIEREIILVIKNLTWIKKLMKIFNLRFK